MSVSPVQASFTDTLPGLWSGRGGFLRPSVAVQPDHDEWRIVHSLWELAIPDEVIRSEPHLREFLERTRPAGGVNPKSAEVVRLIQLFLSQGCTTYDGTRSFYTLSEIRHLVSASCNQWYGRYYEHPYWADLRECRLTVPQLFAWVLRTYHLSRSAGPTASRGAIHSRNPLARIAFAKSAVEEYSHCESYYLPHHPSFGLDRAWVVRLVPTPSSAAFDHQMSTMAEDDWLGHAWVGFFQEYTASFREQAFSLYDRLETAYQLTGFFDGWRDHIGYDITHTHADDFEDLFAGHSEIGRGDLQRSLANASATIEYLLGALDELAELPERFDLRRYRAPLLRSEALPGTDLLFGRLHDVAGLCATETTSDLCRVLIELAFSDRGDDGRVHTGLSAATLADLAFRALSVAECHDDTILLGKWLEVFLARSHGAFDANGQIQSLSAGTRALSNFIREHTRHSPAVLFLFELVESLDNGVHDANRTRESVGRAIRRDDVCAELTCGVRFLEILITSTRHWNRLGANDLMV